MADVIITSPICRVTPVAIIFTNLTVITNTINIIQPSSMVSTNISINTPKITTNSVDITIPIMECSKNEILTLTVSTNSVTIISPTMFAENSILKSDFESSSDTTVYSSTYFQENLININSTGVDIIATVDISSSDYGIVWSNNINPTTADNKVSYGVPSDSNVSILLNATGLQENTSYYARIYQVKDGITTYGNIIQFGNILIYTADDLNNICYNVNSSNLIVGNYLQMADIDLNNYDNWVPIGSGDYPFIGIYDGNNFNITGLTINRSEESYIGLFGCAGDSNGVYLPELKNITLDNVNIIGQYNVGALVGYSGAKITNCKASGTVTGTSSYSRYVGGLIGYQTGYKTTTAESVSNLLNCSSSCSVIVGTDVYPSNFGGLVGYGKNIQFEKCFATGNVLVPSSVIDANTIGGFAGLLTGDTSNLLCLVTNCYATGDVGGSTTATVGGFCGVASKYTTFTNCYSIGNVVGINYTGGFIGYSYSTDSYISCYYNSQTSGQSDNDGRGVPKTTLEMKTQATFTDWDFVNIWTINSLVNNGYPCFGGSSTMVQCSAKGFPFLMHTSRPLAFQW